MSAACLLPAIVWVGCYVRVNSDTSWRQPVQGLPPHPRAFCLLPGCRSRVPVVGKLLLLTSCESAMVLQVRIALSNSSGLHVYLLTYA
jgi:hypothetical protein